MGRESGFGTSGECLLGIRWKQSRAVWSGDYSRQLHSLTGLFSLSITHVNFAHFFFSSISIPSTLSEPPPGIRTIYFRLNFSKDCKLGPSNYHGGVQTYKKRLCEKRD